MFQKTQHRRSARAYRPSSIPHLPRSRTRSSEFIATSLLPLIDRRNATYGPSLCALMLPGGAAVDPRSVAFNEGGWTMRCFHRSRSRRVLHLMIIAVLAIGVRTSLRRARELLFASVQCWQRRGFCVRFARMVDAVADADVSIRVFRYLFTRLCSQFCPAQTAPETGVVWCHDTTQAGWTFETRAFHPTAANGGCGPCARQGI